jgi:7-carboxy-7-deazaguanine synthase
MSKELSELFLCEHFRGVQGEGRRNGVPSIFIRTYNCNLRCTWCDTPYSFDNKDKRYKFTYDEFDQLLKENPNIHMVTFTGGEPLLQANTIAEFISKKYQMMETDHLIYEFETNGTVDPDPIINMIKENVFDDEYPKVHFNISPKMGNSGNSFENRFVRENFDKLISQPLSNYILKFVISNQADLDEVEEFIVPYGILPQQVWLMPEGYESKKIIKGGQWLSDVCLAKGYNLCIRNHVILFENAMGV